MTLSWDETADGRPEWQVRREMEERVAVWLAQGRQRRLLYGLWRAHGPQRRKLLLQLYQVRKRKDNRYAA
jgi:hypothetical protein